MSNDITQATDQGITAASDEEIRRLEEEIQRVRNSEYISEEKFQNIMNDLIAKLTTQEQSETGSTQADITRLIASLESFVNAVD